MMKDRREKDRREHRRELCYAKALFQDSNIPGYIRDISEAGIRIEFPVPVVVEPGMEKTLKVIPEPSIGILPFDVVIEIRTSSEDDGFFRVGALLKRMGEKDRPLFRALIDYYTK